MVVAFLASTILSVVLLRFVPVYFTPLMFLRMAQQIKDGKSITCHHHWVPLEQMSEYMPLAVVASEDQRFYQHHGFDLKAIEKAIEHNQKKGKRTKHGASTISQQTAKNVFLWPDRSLLRKVLESYFTVLIEMMWSKERIMEVYLNSIEMGDGIYGRRRVALSMHCQGFGKRAVCDDSSNIAQSNTLQFIETIALYHQEKRTYTQGNEIYTIIH